MAESFVYRIYANIEGAKFYFCDASGTLSRNASDSMIFLDEATALRYQGLFEHLYEAKFLEPSRLDIEKELFNIFVSRIKKAFV